MTVKINGPLFTSKNGEWGTPKELFDKLDQEFHFTLDACANSSNAKCSNYYSPEDDAFTHTWEGRVWMNPPYGREIRRWMQKAYESRSTAEVVVCLVPARTDTAWWHDFSMKGEIRFIRGRIKFTDGAREGDAPFPSAIVIFRGEQK